VSARPVRSRKLIFAGFIAIATLLYLTACSGSIEWKEDVKLPDGRIITVTRHQEFKGPREFGEPPTESDWWLEFKNPDTGERVRREGHREIFTVALLMDKGAPQLLVRPGLGGAFRTLGCPDPAYLLFQHESGQWKQIPLAVLSGQKLRPNLTISPSDALPDIRAHDHHLDWRLAGHPSDDIQPVDYIDFRNLKEQTFGVHCDKPNMLKLQEGRH